MKIPMPRSSLSQRRVALAWSFLFTIAMAALGPISCGGEQPTSSVPRASAIDVDGDPVALLPPGAVLGFFAEVHGLVTNPALGRDISAMLDSQLPGGQEVGFVPRRDLDRVVVASYGLQGTDTLAVLRGHFDAAAIEKAARSAAGAGVAAQASPSNVIGLGTSYGGHALYTLEDGRFAVLSPKTILAGNGHALELALDRIKSGGAGPGLAPQMVEALHVKDAACAVTGDFGVASLSSLQGLPIPPWVGSVKTLTMALALDDPNVKVTGALGFDAADRAQEAADAVQKLLTLVNTMAVAGVVPKLENLVIKADGTAVLLGFSVEEDKLRNFLHRLPEWLPRARRPVASNDPH
jgi:hypothetical protein